jgi:hypothetical protein
MKIKGILDPFCETGTEGVIWNFNDPTLPGYYQMYQIEGNHLQVLDASGATVWQGKVKLEYKRNWTPYPNQESDSQIYGQQFIGGNWVHGFQENLEPEFWVDMFYKQSRAILTTRYKSPCPFAGSLSGFSKRLKACSDKDRQEYFSGAVYSWMGFFSDGGYFSIGTEIGLSYEEILVLLGNPTKEQIIKAKTYPKYYGETFLPDSDELMLRLFYLYRVYGRLKWQFNPKSAAVWLHTREKTLQKTPISAMSSGLNGLKKVAGIFHPYETHPLLSEI